MDRATTHCSRPEVIDLISVVFEPELILLEIQARSIELYIPHKKISNIIVVVNDADRVADKIQSAWWGINQQKVKIITRSQIGVFSNLDGWSSQQLYKLAAATVASSQWSMCLDSKTWFVQNLDWHKLFDEQGRANFKSFKCMPAFDSALEFSKKFFNIEFENVIGPGGVPFLFHTNTVHDMVNYIEQKTGKKFLDFFANSLLDPHRLTEFVLYSAYVSYANTYNYLYSDNQHYRITNLADWQLDNFPSIIENMKLSDNLTASVQGKAYRLLTDYQLDVWIQFLLTAQLTTDTENTKNLLNTLR